MIRRYNLYKLDKLLIPWISYCPINLTLTNLRLDSRNVESGDLFIAIRGFNTNGKLYINDAVSRGAAAILLETNEKKILIKKHHHFKLIPIVHFYKLNQYVSNIAGRFYGHPSLFLKLIGVTGTNGKTTITHLLANWMELLGEKSAVMGTLGNGTLSNIQPSSHTTCSAVDIQKILFQFVQNDIQVVAMEVSSHGLDQHRVDAVYFNVAIFSNLSHDHLDYHDNIKNYEITKWRLFSELHVEHYIINIDDDIGYQWLSYLPTAVAVTMTNRVPKSWLGRWITLINASYSLYGTDIVFNSSWGSGTVHSQLLGMFNVSNVLLALGALLVLNYPLSLLLSNASRLKPICGRLEIFRSYSRPTVIIDYAHTPDSLKKVLNFVKFFCRGQIWSIFGCGGNRDRSKRALMGYIAEKYSNYVIITNDNPRTENSKSIINDILYKIQSSKKIQIIQNRANAIRTTILQAQSQDFILIFGKGHEQYQIIGNDHINYSDQDIVQDFFDKSFLCIKPYYDST